MNTKAWVACLCWFPIACDGSDSHENASPAGTPISTATALYGTVSSGQYHLGPVDFAETEWHNACAPEGGYVSSLREATGLAGEFLAGVQTGKIAGGANCDACIFISTAKGKTILARVVTYGDTGPNDLDVSPSVYAALNTGEYPRTTTWQWAKCSDTGTLRYEFQTGANVWWTSLWVRNPRIPITKVEVKSKNHPNFIPLARASDGAVADASGFGEGTFTLRVTASDGQTITETFPSFAPGKIWASTQQFQ